MHNLIKPNQDFSSEATHGEFDKLQIKIHKKHELSLVAIFKSPQNQFLPS